MPNFHIDRKLIARAVEVVELFTELRALAWELAVRDHVEHVRHIGTGRGDASLLLSTCPECRKRSAIVDLSGEILREARVYLAEVEKSLREGGEHA